MFRIPPSTDALLTVINWILPHTLWTWVSLTSCILCDTQQNNGSSKAFWRHKRWTLCAFHCVLVADSWLKTVTEWMSYQPKRARNDSDSTIESRLEYQPLCLSISQSQKTWLGNRYASFTLPICSTSELSEVKFSQDPIQHINTDVWLTRCVFGYPKCRMSCATVLQSSWMPIGCCLASNSIKQMKYSCLNSHAYSTWFYASRSRAVSQCRLYQQ